MAKADELGVPLASLKKALLSGEAVPPSLRDALLARGIAAYQMYATADVGAAFRFATEAMLAMFPPEELAVQASTLTPGAGSAPDE